MRLGPKRGNCPKGARYSQDTADGIVPLTILPRIELIQLPELSSRPLSRFKTSRTRTRAGASADGTTKVLLIAHAFSSEVNRKQLAEMAKGLDLRALAPRCFTETWRSASSSEPIDHQVQEFPILELSTHQYLALTSSLGMRSFRPDVIHIDYPPWSLIFWQCLLYRRIYARQAKIVSTVKKNTFLTPSGLRGIVKKYLADFGARYVDRYEASSCLSRSMLEETIEVEPASISVIPHMGVDTELFRPTKPRRSERPKIAIGYCGRYSEHKGLSVLLEATRLNIEAGRDLELRLMGAGPMGDQLRSIASREPWLSVGESCSSIGVAKFMSELDIYALPALILPDHQEHDAHALLQALASGIPAIGTDSGVIPDILGHDTGVIVPPAEVAPLAKAIGKLADNPNLRRSYSEAGLRLISRRYTLRQVAEARRLLYQGLVRRAQDEPQTEN